MQQKARVAVGQSTRPTRSVHKALWVGKGSLLLFALGLFLDPADSQDGNCPWCSLRLISRCLIMLCLTQPVLREELSCMPSVTDRQYTWRNRHLPGNIKFSCRVMLSCRRSQDHTDLSDTVLPICSDRSRSE